MAITLARMMVGEAPYNKRICQKRCCRVTYNDHRALHKEARQATRREIDAALLDDTVASVGPSFPTQESWGKWWHEQRTRQDWDELHVEYLMNWVDPDDEILWDRHRDFAS